MWQNGTCFYTQQYNDETSLLKKKTIGKIVALQKGGGFLLYSFYKGFYIMHNQILIPLGNTKKEETYLKTKIKT